MAKGLTARMRNPRQLIFHFRHVPVELATTVEIEMILTVIFDNISHTATETISTKTPHPVKMHSVECTSRIDD